MNTQEIREKIMTLSEVERIHLTEFIFDSLDKPDKNVEEKWIDESEKRYQLYKEGKIQAIRINASRFHFKP